MYKDDLILGDLYLESAQVSNLTPDQQQKLTSFVVDLVVNEICCSKDAGRDTKV